MEKDFVADETYYLRFDWRRKGDKLAPQSLTFMPVENGAFGVKQLKPVDPENIKEKSIVVTKPD